MCLLFSVVGLYLCKNRWATFTEVEEKERRYHTRCNVANRTSRLFAHCFITCYKHTFTNN